MRPRTLTQSRAKIGAWALLFLGGGVTFVVGLTLTRNVALMLLFAAMGLAALVGTVGWTIQPFFPGRLHLDAEGFEFHRGLGGRPRRAAWRDVADFFVDQNAIGFRANPDSDPHALLAFGADWELPTEWPMSRQALVDLLNGLRQEAVREAAGGEPPKAGA